MACARPKCISGSSGGGGRDCRGQTDSQYNIANGTNANDNAPLPLPLMEVVVCVSGGIPAAAAASANNYESH